MMHCHRLSTTCTSPGMYATCECFPQVRSTYARFTFVGKVHVRRISETSTSFLRCHLTTGSKCSVCSLCFQRESEFIGICEHLGCSPCFLHHVSHTRHHLSLAARDGSVAFFTFSAPRSYVTKNAFGEICMLRDMQCH